MIRKTKGHFQLDAIKRDSKQRDEIIEAIGDDRRMAAMVGDSVPPEVLDQAVKDATAFLKDETRGVAGNRMAEAIVLLFGRPVFFVTDGSVIFEGPELSPWKDLIRNNLDLYKAPIRGVGRIELENHFQYPWVGTGWVITAEHIVTNRHVAEIFVRRQAEQYRFLDQIGNRVLPRIDFLAEHGSDLADENAILELVYVAKDNEPDVAIFRFNDRGANRDRKPLTLSRAPLREQQPIAVIAYPGSDPTTPLLEDMKRIYGGIYEVKRFAPGAIERVTGDGQVFLHDATTLGGASGGAVTDLSTCEVVGLHFAGRERVANYAISSQTLMRLVDQLPQRSFAGGGVPAPVDGGSRDRPIAGTPLLEASRGCRLQPYPNKGKYQHKLEPFQIGGRIRAYASPDSTYAVTRQFFQQAEESITIGIYDFTAPHVLQDTIDALERGVKVTLMLDWDGAEEDRVARDIRQAGGTVVEAPSCASPSAQVFRSSHLKVITIDGRWSLVQSGNYSNNSCPANAGDGVMSSTFKTGNRDTGLAVESRELTALFDTIMADDRQIQLDSERLEMVLEQVSRRVRVPRPPKAPTRLFPSKEFDFSSKVTMQPVLSPDNYVSQTIEWLKTAEHTVRIEQQYIKTGQNLIEELLGAIPSGVDVEIILGKLFDPDDVTHVRELQRRGYKVRIISLKHFTHCHNKMIIIDDQSVMVSSQNWSNAAVSENREAGLIVFEPAIANYFTRIFNADWEMSEPDVEREANASILVRTEAVGGDTIMADLGDYIEV